MYPGAGTLFFSFIRAKSLDFRPPRPMRIARNKDKLEIGSSAADLSQKEALNLLWGKNSGPRSGKLPDRPGGQRSRHDYQQAAARL